MASFTLLLPDCIHKIIPNLKKTNKHILHRKKYYEDVVLTYGYRKFLAFILSSNQFYPTEYPFKVKQASV